MIYLLKLGKKIINIILKPQSLFVGTLAITFFSLMAKALGFFREIIIAYKFGTSFNIDYIIAIVNPIMGITATLVGGIVTAMIPIYIKLKKQKGLSLARKYIILLFFIVSISLSLLGFLFYIFPMGVAKVFVPGFSHQKLMMAIRLLKYLAIYPLAFGMMNFLFGVLKAEKLFIQLSLFQTIFPFFTIIGIFSLYRRFHELSYPLSFMGSAILIDGIILFFCFPRNSFDIKYERNQKLLRKEILHSFINSIPLFINGGLSVINTIVDKAFASYLLPGRISALNYSKSLVGAISSIVSLPFLTTVYVEFSENAAEKNLHKTEKILKLSLKYFANFSLPIIFFLLYFSKFIIGSLFQRGEFNGESLKLVQGAFVGYLPLFFFLL